MLQAARVGAPWMWTLPLANMKIERRRTARRFRRAELTGSRRGTLSRIEYGKLKRNHAGFVYLIR